jgi:hypothetical protein
MISSLCSNGNNVAADKRFHRAGIENLLKAEALEKG